MTGARAVIAPIDNVAWLPVGLARQLREWLDRMGFVRYAQAVLLADGDTL